MHLILFHCLPKITIFNFYQLGLNNTYLRQKLMKCAEDYQNTQERLAAKLGSDVSGDAEATPTAPPARQELSSAPSAPPMEPTIQPIETFQSSECVVCLEMKVRRQTRSLCKSSLTQLI